jgi:hypothetical protein
MPGKKGANMMSKVRVVLALSLIFGVSAATLRAEQPGDAEATEASVDALVSAIRANRKALVAVNFRLSDDEAAKFWPIYDRYQKEINAVGDRWVALIQDYTESFPDLSNDKAMKLVEDYLAVEADRVRARRAYVPEFAAILPGRKVARLYQIENKMDAVIRYDLAATIPVLEQENGAAAK